jgi:hypothetical protein
MQLSTHIRFYVQQKSFLFHLFVLFRQPKLLTSSNITGCECSFTLVIICFLISQMNVFERNYTENYA